jgi:glycosyltransferase involved in cell wall biosynthesis
MRVLVNALSARLGGGQTYILNILKNIPTHLDIKIYLLAPLKLDTNDLPSNINIIKIKSIENPFKRVIWEVLYIRGLLNKLNIDLLFCPGGSLPLFIKTAGVKTAVTFQNMLPFDYIQRKKYSFGYRRLRDWLLEQLFTSSMRQADLVIFISKFARKFVKQHLEIDIQRSVVIPHGIQSSFKVANKIRLPKPIWLPNCEYFLYVSWVDYYKGQLEVLRGFHQYRLMGGKQKLVFVGAEYSPYANLVRQEIVKLDLTQYVLMMGNINHEELPAAYQNAQVNIFASFTENCPNILLEIMASGRPALVSKYGVMPEFGKDAVRYFDPSSPQDFSTQLNLLVSDKNMQIDYAKAALKQSEKYTWQLAAKKTWQAIKNTEKNSGCI